MTVSLSGKSDVDTNRTARGGGDDCQDGDQDITVIKEVAKSDNLEDKEIILHDITLHVPNYENGVAITRL